MWCGGWGKDSNISVHVCVCINININIYIYICVFVQSLHIHITYLYLDTKQSFLLKGIKGDENASNRYKASRKCRSHLLVGLG